MVVLGYGIREDYSDRAVQQHVRDHLTTVGRWGGSAPRLVFLASDARHRSDFERQTDEHVVAFNGKMVPPTLFQGSPNPTPPHARAACLVGRRPSGVVTRTVTHSAVGRCSSPSMH